MRPTLKTALAAVTLSSAVVALAACGSSYYRTGYYSSGYVYDRPAVVYDTSPSYVVPNTVIADTYVPNTVIADTYVDDCSAVYRPAYCSYPRFGGTVVIGGVSYRGLHFRDGRFGREFWLNGAWHRIG